MDYRAYRYAENEARFRAANERIEDRVAAVVDSPDTRVPFLCECSDVDCAARITLTLAEYERVRSDPTWFVVGLDHERTEVDAVLERHETYLLVCKRGQAGAVAAALDDRD
jgi:hypothetical protein